MRDSGQYRPSSAVVEPITIPVEFHGHLKYLYDDLLRKSIDRKQRISFTAVLCEAGDEAIRQDRYEVSEDI